MNKDRFKFRVWNKEKGKYLCEEYRSAVLNGDGSLSILDFSDGELTEFSDDAYYGAGNCIIEQCTGLRDKNGRLIYEGDIVTGIVGLNKERFRGTVFWSEEQVSWMISGDFYITAFEDIKRIGNIHEEAKDE